MLLIANKKAVKAQEEGKFKDEIVPVVIKGKKGDIIVDTDEGPRPGTTAEGIGKIKTSIRKKMEW